ncbi:MAG: hypothetical protein HYZ23_04955 [Chloroflexi bacterium]|nr:hypothetical protein [Chloroflexota bacterium]
MNKIDNDFSYIHPFAFALSNIIDISSVVIIGANCPNAHFPRIRGLTAIM